MDIFAGGVGHPLGSQNQTDRTIGRAVGSYFLGRGLNNLTDTSWAGPAARGAASVLGGSGGDDGSGRGGLGEVLSGGTAMPQDNSMIAPLHMPDLFADSGPSMSPDLLAFMLAPRRGGGEDEQQDNQPYLGGGGLA